MKEFKTVLFAALLALCQAASGAEGDLLDARDSQDAPIPIILDTDIGGDIDDVSTTRLRSRLFIGSPTSARANCSPLRSRINGPTRRVTSPRRTRSTADRRFPSVSRKRPRAIRIIIRPRYLR